MKRAGRIQIRFSDFENIARDFGVERLQNGFIRIFEYGPAISALYLLDGHYSGGDLRLTPARARSVITAALAENIEEMAGGEITPSNSFMTSFAQRIFKTADTILRAGSENLDGAVMSGNLNRSDALRAMRHTAAEYGRETRTF